VRFVGVSTNPGKSDRLGAEEDCPGGKGFYSNLKIITMTIASKSAHELLLFLCGNVIVDAIVLL